MRACHAAQLFVGVLCDDEQRTHNDTTQLRQDSSLWSAYSVQSSLRRSRLRALVQLVFPVSSLEFIVCLLRRRVCTTWLFDRIHRRVTIFVVVAVVGAASAGDSRAASARHAHSARALADF